LAHIAFKGGYEQTLSLTLPDVAEGNWSPPPSVVTGLPPAAATLPITVDLWKYLACLGGLGIFAEWWIFGHKAMRTARRSKPVSIPQREAQGKREKELVSQ